VWRTFARRIRRWLGRSSDSAGCEESPMLHVGRLGTRIGRSWYTANPPEDVVLVRHSAQLVPANFRPCCHWDDSGLTEDRGQP
jgi:hypothetical protein